MKISKKSWHYQLIKMLNIVTVWDRKDLCGYMRGLLITMLVPTLLVLAPFVWYVLHTSGILYTIPTTDVQTMIITVLFLWALVGTTFDAQIVIFVLFVWISGYLPEREYNPRKEPNIVIEYIRAKKKKICPMIEFEE